MAKFHVNPETGVASQCSATFKCPFGDLEDDHYSTAAAARKSFEGKMSALAEAVEDARKAKAAKRLGDPILLKPVNQTSYKALYYLDYDYESSYNHPPEEDICRCGVIDEVKINGWGDNGEDLANYARDRIGLKADAPLPEELYKELKPFIDNFDSTDYEPIISGGYYGEELDDVELPKELDAILDNYFYNQPNAEGPEGVLSYLRGKGYDTTGERPLEAIKGALQAENNGRLVSKVAKAKKWRAGEISLDRIKLPSESQRKAGENDPRPLTNPYPGKAATSSKVAGVVIDSGNGNYELIDGYHRLAHLKQSNRKRSRYLVLSNEAYTEYHPNYWSSEKSLNWHKD